MDKLGTHFESRESGILLPFRAMHGDHDHQGTFGPESREVVEYMSQSGFGIWQDLPVSPPDPFESPYASDSAFAIDPQRIDLFQLAEVGDINRFELDRYQKLAQRGDAGPEIRDMKRALLRQAFLGFAEKGSPERKETFSRWYEEEAEWLDYYAAFQILKEHPDNTDWRWQNWEHGRDFDEKVVTDVKSDYNEEFVTLCYEQWVAEEQTLRFLKDAESHGVEVWGDVPFYVNGGEVWANREVFDLHPDGNLRTQGGAEASMTSATGQAWGFATYNVGDENNSEQTDRVVDWWSKRLARARKLHSGPIRLDHWIGFAEPWILKGNATDGLDGYRGAGIGRALFDRERQIHGNMLPYRYYPEDLGTQTEKTPELRDRYELDANTLAIRAFTKHVVLGEYDESIHNPDNYRYKSVDISSNHDSPTFIQGLDCVRKDYSQEFLKYLDYVNQKFPESGIRIDTPSERIAQFEMERVLRSVGRVAIMGIWDVLKLGPEGRYNVPNTILQENWSWRMKSEDMSQLNNDAGYWLRLNEETGRAVQPQSIAAAAD